MRMGALELIATILLVIFELFLIIVVLLQSGKSAGLSASFGGSTETFLGKISPEALKEGFKDLQLFQLLVLLSYQYC